VTVVGGAVGAILLAGCASPGYNESRLQSQLEHAGTTAAQARCVTKGLTDKYAVSQLGSHSEPSENELAFTLGLLKRCKVTVPLQPR
jgi:hypothetical protein